MNELDEEKRIRLTLQVWDAESQYNSINCMRWGQYADGELCFVTDGDSAYEEAHV